MSRRLLIALLALAAVPVLAQPASAHNRHDGNAYEYRGTVTALTGDQLQVQVTGGNRAALKSLIGATQPTTFKVDATTKVVVESDGPHAGTLGDLAPGDSVVVVYRGVQDLTAAQLATTPATRVWDVTGKNRPHGRLFLYAGTITALDPATSAISVNINFGNWRGLYSLLGQPTAETFHYDASTTFVKWAAKQPYTVPVSELHVGDPITLHVIAPSWDTPLATLLATPAYRVRIGEPRAAVLHSAQTDGGVTKS